MTDVALRYRRPRDNRAGDDLRLVYGGSGVAPPPPPPPPPPAPLIGALRSALAAPWSASASPARPVLQVAWRAALGETGRATAAPWAVASLQARAATAAAWIGGTGLRGASVATPWSGTLALDVSVGLGWSGTQRRRAAWAAPWATAGRATRHTAAAWGAALSARAGVAAPWQTSEAYRRAWIVAAQAAISLRAGCAAPWQVGQALTSTGGPWAPPVPPPPPPPVTCHTTGPGDALLLQLRRAHSTGSALALRLLLACIKPALIVIPIRRAYVVTNVTSLTRVSDGANIPCEGFTLSLDVDSWAWGFSASLPGDSAALITPATPGAAIELQATVNGTSVRVLAESMRSERSFGRHTVSVQGRGLTALLEAPYEVIQTWTNAGGALTAAQIIEQALPSGWTSTWLATDWLVPAGAWSHQGTPVSVARTVAEAAGLFLRPHLTTRGWDVLPRYPVGPWDWSTLTADVSLPSAIVEVEGIEAAEKARYNRVYVAGSGTSGRLVRVTRSGSAGDVVAPMVTHPLITHLDAGRQRGLAVLSDAGRVATVTLRLPVMPPAGVLRPGQIVDYTDGATTRRGLVRGVSVSVSGGAVWQSVALETNMG